MSLYKAGVVAAVSAAGDKYRLGMDWKDERLMKRAAVSGVSEFVQPKIVDMGGKAAAAVRDLLPGPNGNYANGAIASGLLFVGGTVALGVSTGYVRDFLQQAVISASVNMVLTDMK